MAELVSLAHHHAAVTGVHVVFFYFIAALPAKSVANKGVRAAFPAFNHISSGEQWDVVILKVFPSPLKNFINKLVPFKLMKRVITEFVDRFLARSQSRYKQVILVRADLKLPPGKLAAQVAHASVDAVMESDKKILTSWHREGMKKVVLRVKNEQELLRYAEQARKYGLVTCVVVDAGKTVVEPGTRTCCGIGPDIEKKIDVVTGKLSIF